MKRREMAVRPVPRRGLLLALLAAWAGGGRAGADTVAQWDFEGALAATTGQAPLVAVAVAPASIPSVAFETAVVAGRTTGVARFGRGTAFRVRPGLGPNGGGQYLNRYTLVLDVAITDPAPLDGSWSLFQTNPDNTNAGDWFVAPAVPPGDWHRLALVVDLNEGKATSYVDGVKQAQISGQSIDGRLALYTTADGALEGFLLFADNGGRTAGGLIDAFQVRDSALCPEDIAALGGIADRPLSAASIPARICQPTPVELAIKVGPYLQWATMNEITVMWETTAPAESTVLYRGTGDWIEAPQTGNTRIHEVRLGGFTPRQEVEYRVQSRLDGRQVESEINAFRTNPAGETPFQFVVWGDNHDNVPVFSKLIASMVTGGPDLAVAVGDVVDVGADYYRWGDQLLTPLYPMIRSVPLYIAIGNHEANSHWFYDYLAQPGNEHWFSFDYAGSHFVIIDTNFPFAPGSEQYQWLEKDLFSPEAKGARWLFTFHHHPPYSEIYEEVIYARIRMHLVPLFEAAGVDIDFSGHIHDYERGVYIPPDTGRRIAYIQTSGAGGRLWDDEFGGQWEQIEKVIQYVHHYCVVDIDGEHLTLRAISLDGTEIDRIDLTAMSPRTGEPPSVPPPASGSAVTQWDFEDGDLRATFGPGTLEYLDGDGGQTWRQTQFGTTDQFGLPAIGGRAARVMKFPRASVPAMGFRIDPGADSNGGGSFINEYTLIFDLLVPTSVAQGNGWLSLLNTNPQNTNDGDAFVRFPDGGIGISGHFEGAMSGGAWHRVALVFAVSDGQTVLRKAIDGKVVGVQGLGAIDGRWSLNSALDDPPYFLLLTDDTGETSGGFLASLAFASRAFGVDEIAALGGPDAAGILDGPCQESCRVPYRRGDANADGQVNVADAVFSLMYLYLSGQEPSCKKSLDVDDSGTIDITDPLRLLFTLFGGAPPLGEPSASCGPDPTPDALDCLDFEACK